MSLLSSNNLNSLLLPLKGCQQLADLRFLQGQYIAQKAPTSDLLAGMAVKSRLTAIKTTQQQQPLFDYKSALDYLISLDPQTPLTIDQLQQLHRQLNPQGGQWRSVKLSLPRRDQPGQLIHISKGKQAIAETITLLLDELQQALDNGYEPLIVIPLFALELITLFPFFDGNRRLMLLLSHHLLIANGHQVARYIDLESEFSASGKAFYRLLYQYSQDKNPNKWLSYWWVLIKRLYQRFDRQVQHANIAPGRGSKTALIERFVKQQQQPFRMQDVCKAFPTISRDQIRIVLRSLRDQQIIQTQGRGPAAVWLKL